MSSPDPKTENPTDSKPPINVPSPSEKLGDSSPELGDSNSSEKLKDSSTVWKDPVESYQAKEGECKFCVYMKRGGCRESFTAWEVCMEEAEKNKEDIFTKCMEVNSKLFKCMDAHSDYYQPILAKKNKVEEEEISEEEAAVRKLAQVNCE